MEVNDKVYGLMIRYINEGKMGGGLFTETDGYNGAYMRLSDEIQALIKLRDEYLNEIPHHIDTDRSTEKTEISRIYYSLAHDRLDDAEEIDRQIRDKVKEVNKIAQIVGKAKFRYVPDD